jgi:hypothetical protein
MGAHVEVDEPQAASVPGAGGRRFVVLVVIPSGPRDG